MSMPDSASRSGVVLEMAEEFLDRYRRGERPSLKEYTDRHPSLADEIRDVFPAMAMMEKIALADESLAGDLDGAARPHRTGQSEQFGDFRIVREVGRGGMGVVYEAEQVSLGRHVALKVLPPQAVRDANQMRRFEREAKAAAHLHHTNIVPVFGVGEHNAAPFFVMQLIQGLGLDQVIDELKRLKAPKAAAPAVVPAVDKKTSGRDVSAADIARSLLTGRFDLVGTNGVAGSRTEGPPTATDTQEITPAALASTSSSERSAVALPYNSPSSPSVSLLGTRSSGAGRGQKRKNSTYWEGVARIGAQVADALEYAHKQGVIHRDIKPSNLLLDGRGTVWVTDFGLAKMSDKQDLTHTGDILGTLRYMPPEAFEGRSSARGDVYSLGMTLYELFAFRPAFGEKERGRLIRQVTTEEPPRLGKLNPEVPRDLETIVQKAIERDPSRRYDSSGELAADLLRFLDDQPIPARRLTLTERLGRWSRRHKGVAALLATLFTVLTVGFAVMALLWFRAEHSAAVARTNELIAKDLAAKEADARGRAQAQERIAVEKAESLAREDYINRVNRAYREVQDDNVALAEDLLHGCPPERRGWEWHFVERLCNSQRLGLDLGDASVNALAFSPDGKWVVSGSGASTIGLPSKKESTVEVRDSGAGGRRRTLFNGKGTVFAVAVSPGGTKVAAGCGGGHVQVWDSADGRSQWSRTDPGYHVMSVAFSRDGAWLAVGYGFYSEFRVGLVKVLDAASGAEIRSFSGPAGGVNKVAFDANGKRLAVAGLEVVEVRDLPSGTKVLDLKGHTKWVYCVAFSPDGKWLATGGWDRTVKLRNAETGVETLTIFAHEGFVLDLAFSPDGRHLVTTSEDRSAKLWEIPTGRQVATFHGHTDFVLAVACRADGREFATAGLDGSVRFWDLRTSRAVVIEHSGWVERLAFRRDGLRVLSEVGRLRTGAEATRGWNPFTGETDPTLVGTSFQNLPDGYATDSEIGLATATSPDGKWIAQGRTLGDTAGTMRSKGFATNSIVLREAAGGRVVHMLTGHSAEVVSLAFSPDGRRLASASSDRTLKLWDTTTGQDVFTLRGHTAGVRCLAFSPDGNILVSGGIDSTARVWNATPLLARVTAEHDARYTEKVTTLAQLRATTDDARRAEILAGGGQWGMAADAFARALEKRPGERQVWFQYIQALLEAGEESKVPTACANLLGRFGDSADPLEAAVVRGFCRLAIAAVSEPEKRGAVRELVRADHVLWRGGVLAKYGQIDLLADAFGKVVDADPNTLNYRYLHMLALLELGDVAGYR
jgi:WD40 repeat protein/serine/threonine protein kinase